MAKRAGSLILPGLLAASAAAFGCSSDETSGSDSAGQNATTGCPPKDDQSCEAQACRNELTTDTYETGLSREGESGMVVRFLGADPSPPERFDNIWNIEITNAAGEPVVGAGLDVDPFMPDHGHGAPVAVMVTNNGDGTYELNPVNFFMPGLWRTTIDIYADGITDQVRFVFCAP